MRCHDQIFKNFYLIGLHQAWINFDGAQRPLGCETQLYKAAASFAINLHLLELLLRFSHFSLHLLSLLHQAGELTFVEHVFPLK